MGGKLTLSLKVFVACTKEKVHIPKREKTNTRMIRILKVKEKKIIIYIQPLPLTLPIKNVHCVKQSMN